MKILVCYDIPEDKIRSKAAKYLEGVGRRLQYSVFCVEEDSVSFPGSSPISVGEKLASASPQAA